MQDTAPLSLGAQLGALERQQAPAVSVLFSSPSQLLYIFFPLLVLFVCFHAISSHSPASPSLSISASIRAFRLHLATLQHFFPQSLSSALVHPPFYFLIAPFISLFLFRLLPVLLGQPPVPAAGVVVTYRDIFLSPAFFLTQEKSSFSLSSVFLPIDGSYSPLMRFLLHPFFVSPSSLIFWLTAGPFLLYSCCSYVYLHFEEGRGFSVAGPQAATPRHPALRATTALLICTYMPAVFMTWLVAHISPTSAAASFRYIGVEGAIYALALLVFLYDPVSGPPTVQTWSQLRSPWRAVRTHASVRSFKSFRGAPPSQLSRASTAPFSLSTCVSWHHLLPCLSPPAAFLPLVRSLSRCPLGGSLSVAHSLFRILLLLRYPPPDCRRCRQLPAWEVGSQAPPEPSSSAFDRNTFALTRSSRKDCSRGGIFSKHSLLFAVICRYRFLSDKCLLCMDVHPPVRGPSPHPLRPRHARMAHRSVFLDQ